MRIGKIVKSNSHIDYICQIYGPTEDENQLLPADYAFGTFVRIALHTQPVSWLVGLIYDSVLLNPDFGRLGPRLSPQSELTVFSPDYLNEKATLVGIVAVGTLNADGGATQGVPSLVAATDAVVERMTDDQVLAFHSESLALRLAYAPLLMGEDIPLASHLLRSVIARLGVLFTEPECIAVLDLLMDELNWQSQIGPMGGGR
jgi:hypothetical protein